ncbi:FMN-binding protein [Micromonospora sp. KLBMP9576]|uniref:FMN-binding protein n=1 Tax=Micromonospora sp. KLBMP9576 TaxID=3424769 RepID=UPI003D90C06D
MRRVLLAITGLAAGTTAMVVLKGSPGVTPVAQDLPTGRPPVLPTPAGAAPTGEAASATPSPSRRAASPRPGRTATRTPASRPSTTTRVPSAPRTTSKPPPAPKTRTVAGPVVENEYGNVQVQITLSGTRIVDVVALELPEETAQSDQRSEQVDGRYSGSSGLVVQRQSADVDTVSGATTTSGSYKRSLQAAIDKAN